MNTPYVCNECMTHVTEHADGALACSCVTRDPLETVPARWVVAATDETVTREMLDN